ncbi:nitroreductase family deazaflavin-dependent oxidoreductase [Rhabdothermincola sp.]|uniref:nitroreductase family deazaflavin-dependent oxidoreductase n=1 Tax=Rhabdothermincola sp. TaxID=2820405 RepID=UPI002FE410C2
MVDDDYCHLITTGRQTGRDHRVEMWYVRDGSTVYLLAGAGRSTDWVRNLEADPRARIRIGDQELTATGRVLDAPGDREEAAMARELLYTKYQPRYEGLLDDWRDRALPVALDLQLAS